MYAGHCTARKPSTALHMLLHVAMLLLCHVALLLLEVILLSIHNRNNANPQSGTVRTNVWNCYSELYWVQSLDCGH